MINLFDIMRQAQGGTALPSLARQFGLDGQQTQTALDALLPAFSLAFRRNAMDPNAFAGFIDLMTSGRYAPFFDGSAALSPGAAAGGQDLLGALFGSKEVTRQVATQAASATGLGVQVLQEMMPVVAATLVGGMFRYASVEGFADLLRKWSDGLKASAPASSRPAPAPSHPWSHWMHMMGAAPRPPEPPPPKVDLSGADPFQAWAKVMGTLTGPSSPPPPAPAPPPAPPSAPNPFEALASMYETGRTVQAQHLASLQSILDGVWGTGRTR